MQITSVPASALEFPSVRNGELEGFHGNDVCLSESFRQLGRGHDRDGGAVRDPAAFVQPKGLRNHRGVDHRVDIDRRPEERRVGKEGGSTGRLRWSEYS